MKVYIATAAILVLVLAACGGEAAPPEGAPATEPPPPVTRMRLFDRMHDAKITRAEEESDYVETKRWEFDFTESSPADVWFGRSSRRGTEWRADGVSIEEGAGREGGALVLGPEIESDGFAAVVVLPSRGRARLRVSGRVKLVGHPDPESGRSRECLRIVEHRERFEDPTEGRHRTRWSARVSRKHDPSGWDTFEREILTDGSTETIELRLLHRTGGAPGARTLFDDIVVEEAPLAEADLLEFLTRRYRPRDGQEDLTPWRLRVELGGEVRDATLVHTDGALAFEIEVPNIDSEPTLRFSYGALPETRRQKGDGSMLRVVFEGEEEIELGNFVLDAKNSPGDLRWKDANVDLAPVAGRAGELSFRVADVDEEPDDLDAILVSTPRIEPKSDAPNALNVLLIGVDTLRADHLSAFGYERGTTPVLTALAEEGVRFAGTRSQAPWTLPSFSSILTSLYPSAHGAGRGGHDEWEPIDPTTLALPEVLQRNGYETAGIVANGLISPRYGLDQGFDSYRAAWAMESVDRDAPRVAEWVSTHTRSPWFMFWHIMDPHLPYETGEEHRAEFTDETYDGQFAGDEPSVPFRTLDPRPGRRWYAHEGPPPLPELTEADAQFVSDYYDAEIAEVDAAIGRVLDAVRESGQWNRTIVALVADHGEGLADHGHYHHGYTLFDDQVHIPMIVRIPGAHVGETVDRPVAAIDLAPTLLGALGIPAPESFQGVDRLASDAPKDDHFFVEYPTYDSSAQKAWIEGRFKYLHDPLFHTEALYDFVADPGEKSDVAGEHPEVVARARKALDAFRLAHIDRGRFHLRVHGDRGQQLTVRITTNDLFDANFVSLPQIDERSFEMDLERTYLALDTELTNPRQEIVFWCRGSELEIDVALDGAPVEGILLGNSSDRVDVPATLARSAIPELRKRENTWPDQGFAEFWLEEGAGNVVPVVNTPEEIERLRELGYGH